MATWLIILILIVVLSVLDDIIAFFTNTRSFNNTSTITNRTFVNGKLVSETVEKKD